MKNHNYLPAEKLAELGGKLSEVQTDIEIIRAFSDGFDNPSKLTKDEMYMSYVRAYQFFELLHRKAQHLEGQLDDVAVLLLEAGNYKTLQEHLPIKDMNLPTIKG